MPETAAWRSQSPVGGYHFSETRPTGAVEKYPQTPLVTLEDAIAYGAACAAEQRERDAQICDGMSVDGLPEMRPTDEHELACHIRQIVCGVACAAAIRASATPAPGPAGEPDIPRTSRTS